MEDNFGHMKCQKMKEELKLFVTQKDLAGHPLLYYVNKSILNIFCKMITNRRLAKILNKSVTKNQT
jgi:hypothetical protein